MSFVCSSVIIFTLRTEGTPSCTVVWHNHTSCSFASFLGACNRKCQFSELHTFILQLFLKSCKKHLFSMHKLHVQIISCLCTSFWLKCILIVPSEMSLVNTGSRNKLGHKISNKNTKSYGEYISMKFQQKFICIVHTHLFQKFPHMPKQQLQSQTGTSCRSG